MREDIRVKKTWVKIDWGIGVSARSYIDKPRRSWICLDMYLLESIAFAPNSAYSEIDHGYVFLSRGLRTRFEHPKIPVSSKSLDRSGRSPCNETQDRKWLVRSRNIKLFPCTFEILAKVFQIL